MAENKEEMFTEALKQQLFNLDQSIPVPPMPDTGSLFDKLPEAGKKKNNVRLFRVLGTAAVACICLAVLIPMLKNGLRMGSAASETQEVAEDGDMLAMEAPNMYDDGTEEGYAEEAAPEESPEVEAEAAAGTEESTAKYGGGETRYTASVTCGANSGEEENETVSSLQQMLADYYAAGGQEPAALPQEGEQIYDTGKRRVEISPAGDSVSVLVYDISGQEELLSGFWVEGSYVSSDLAGDGQTCAVVVAKAITPEEVKSGDIMPQVGDLSGYTEEISEESVTIPDAVVPRITMTASIDLSSGNYKIVAELK